MWKRYFKFIKLKPGRVVTQQFGELDFSSDKIPLETVKSLYENDFPYLEITHEGKVELYGMHPEEEITDEVIIVQGEPAEEETTESVPVEPPVVKAEKPIRKTKKSDVL